MDIRYKIFELLKLSNSESKEFADAIGVSKQTVSNWKSGISNSFMKKLPEIAGFFGITVDDLVSESVETLINSKQKKPSAEVIDEELDKNVLVIRGRDGRYIRKKLTDEEIQSLEILLKSLPDVSDDV